MKHKKLAMSVGDWNTEGRVLGSATNRQIVFLKSVDLTPSPDETAYSYFCG